MPIKGLQCLKNNKKHQRVITNYSRITLSKLHYLHYQTIIQMYLDNVFFLNIFVFSKYNLSTPYDTHNCINHGVFGKDKIKGAPIEYRYVCRIVELLCFSSTLY